MALGFFVGAVALILAAIFQIQMVVPGAEEQFDAMYWRMLFVPSCRGFGVLMVAAGVWLLWHLGRKGRFELASCGKTQGGDSDRLKTVFEFSADQVLANVARLAGQGSARRAEHDLAVQIRTMGWGLEVMNLRASAARLQEQELSQLAGTLSAALSSVFEAATSVLGRRVVERLCTRIYDQIHWEDRELASTYMFGDTRWAGVVAEAPALRRDDLVTALGNTILFARLSAEELEAFGTRFHPESYEAGDILIRQGDDGDRFFVIQTGTVEVLAEDSRGGHRVLAYLRSGDYFGEVALLADVPRTATVRAVTGVGVYSLVREDFEEATADLGQSAESMVDAIRDIRRLRSVPMLRSRPESELFILLTKLDLKEWEPDTTVFEQGTVGDQFYIIRSGEVAIEAGDNGGPAREVATLRAGEYFGEIALVSDVPRTAGARTKARTELWSLAKEDFLELVQSQGSAAQALEQTASRRLIELRQ